MLYIKDSLTQQEIAEKVGVSRQTVARWSKEEKWEEHKVGVTLTREQQIANLHRQVAEINKVIASREDGQRYANAAEADTINSVGMKFINWLRPYDLDRSKEYLKLWDAFIKDSL